MSYAQTIFNRLRQAGMTEAGALGMLGNFQAESCCEPGRLEGDNDRYRTLSKDYVSRIMSGAMSKAEFCKARGFGLAQWTYPTRKAALWDAWKASGKAVDNVLLQVDFAISELKTDFPELWRFLCSSNDVYQCTKRICYDFENPAIKNVDTRFRDAQELKTQLDLNAWQNGAQPDPPADQQQPQPPQGWETIPATEYWPPRMICKGMEGPDVAVLQAVLYARGYMIAQIDGSFGSYLKETVKTFQKSFNLDVDGIVGPKTWGKLLERG